ncbi:sterol uptake control protein 2 [Triangularia setosa]|uniref:Sterol uptake control protein 2 n=1 Tax=Triangularia setosa TaxID=2587417 RepID=A0AAN6W1C5_9PEZI|nr:sterol uptake control protein 2 [Podospora setosa]
MAPIHAITFTNTFLVTSNEGDQHSLRVVGPKEARRKRPHRSRTGCIRCKRRKVKCDEGDPCSNCVKRKESCIRRSPPPSRAPMGVSFPTSVPQVSCSPFSEPEYSPINLLHMELLHHFERWTIPTLAFKHVWPLMLPVAFQSRHTYLVNGMLSLAAAHLDYLCPGNIHYHRAKYVLLNKALADYRSALSLPITTENCDAMLGTANLIHYLMWSDLSFMDCQASDSPLDLSGDRLYHLSTGVRQVFFQAWEHFQHPDSVFSKPGLLQPCMAIEDAVEVKGLNWQRYVKGFMGLYDNPRYHGTGPSSTRQQKSSSCPMMGSPKEENEPRHPSQSDNYFRVVTLWHSYTEGVAYLQSGGLHDEALLRAAYKRLVSRLAVGMAYLSDRSFTKSCPFSAGYQPSKPAEMGLKQEDLVRYVLTISMMCFGPLLQLIGSGGDSRMLILLLHIYRVVGVLLPPGGWDKYWWCRRRVVVMEEAIGREMRRRGVEVCLRRQGEVV